MANDLTLAMLGERFNLHPVDLHIIRDACCKGASIGQLGLYLYQCKKLGLDPMLKQAHWINGAFVIGIDGFRSKAEETGEYLGSLPPQWLNEKGQWVEEWTENGPPVSARVSVQRKGFDRLITATCKYSSFAKPNSEAWRRMPEHMLAKCAEAGAIRKAFPMVFGGVYSTDEITKDGKIIEPEKEDDDDELPPKAAAGPALFIGPDGRTDEERGGPYDPAQDMAGTIIKALQEAAAHSSIAYKGVKDKYREDYAALDEIGRERVQSAMKELER